MKVVTWNVAGLRAETVASSLKQTHHSFTFSANAYYVSLLYFMSSSKGSAICLNGKSAHISPKRRNRAGTVKWRVAPGLRSGRIKKEEKR